MSVFAPTLGALWKQLEGYGIDPDPVFRKAGIDPETMFDAGARVPIENQQAVRDLAFELSGDPQFGLRAYEYLRPAHLGALGFAWLASATLREAFHRISRYARVIQENLSVETHEEDGVFWVRVDPHLDEEDWRTREDSALAALIRFCRVIAGEDLSPARIRFRQVEPDNTSYHYELFRSPIEFEHEHTEMAFEQRDVDKRLLGSNDELANLNEHIVVKYLAHRERQDIVNQVKAAIIDGLASGPVTEKSVAESLFTSPRNLHRKLMKEDTSFKHLLTEIRQDLARQYIQDRSKTLTEISYLLGFSEVSSFSRAFKNWTGMPPSAARQA
jgi:AraC-like DNA-binding protein